MPTPSFHSITGSTSNDESLTRLSEAELCFFKAYGYLIKRGAVPLALCNAALDRMWESAPASIRRNDPSTWKPIAAPESSADALLVKQGTRWQLRAASTEAALIDVAYNAQLVTWAEQLLGAGTLRAPTVGGKPMGSWGPAWPGGPVDPQLGEGVRGIYATLPVDPASTASSTALEDHLHTDGHPFHLGLVVLLEENLPNGGGFKVWPSSHRRFYPLFPLQYDQPRVPFYPHLPTMKGPVHSPAYLAEVQRVEADTRPVDCYGEAGDIILWHHRMGHMAGHNTQATPTIRQALLYDFCKVDLDQTRADPPQPDMWRDWGPELRAADAPITPQLLHAQRIR